MKTPKEKAKELVYKYDFLKEIFIPSIHEQKQCALIAVDEIIESNPCFEDYDRGGNFMWNNNIYYWTEVKEEINKL
jgi:hypothetical protein